MRNLAVLLKSCTTIVLEFCQAMTPVTFVPFEYLYRKSGIFYEIDRPLDFNETFVNSSVLNVVSINDTRFLRKSLFKKLLAFSVIYFACNSEQKKNLIFHIYYMLENFLSKKNKQILMCICDTNFYRAFIKREGIKIISYNSIQRCYWQSQPCHL